MQFIANLWSFLLFINIIRANIILLQIGEAFYYLFTHITKSKNIILNLYIAFVGYLKAQHEHRHLMPHSLGLCLRASFGIVLSSSWSCAFIFIMPLNLFMHPYLVKLHVCDKLHQTSKTVDYRRPIRSHTSISIHDSIQFNAKTS